MDFDEILCLPFVYDMFNKIRSDFHKNIFEKRFTIKAIRVVVRIFDQCISVLLTYTCTFKNYRKKCL